MLGSILKSSPHQKFEKFKKTKNFCFIVRQLFQLSLCDAMVTSSTFNSDFPKLTKLHKLHEKSVEGRELWVIQVKHEIQYQG